MDAIPISERVLLDEGKVHLERLVFSLCKIHQVRPRKMLRYVINYGFQPKPRKEEEKRMK